MAAESRRLVILALVANFLIAVTKFVAAAISQSSAMLSEAIHSLADTGNQLFHEIEIEPELHQRAPTNRRTASAA